MNIELLLNKPDHVLAFFGMAKEVFIQEWTGLKDNGSYYVLRIRYYRILEATDKFYVKEFSKWSCIKDDA